jgi:acyl-CoA thioesterase
VLERLERLLDLEKYKKYFNKADMFSVNNGMQLVEIGEGYARAEMTISKNSMNYMGSMHGGLLYTMADITAGTAFVFRGKQCVTLSANTDYIKPAFSGRVIAEARVISPGKTVCRCEVDIRGEDGTLYCKSHITMFVTDKNVVIPE